MKIEIKNFNDGKSSKKIIIYVKAITLNALHIMNNRCAFTDNMNVKVTLIMNFIITN